MKGQISRVSTTQFPLLRAPRRIMAFSLLILSLFSCKKSSDSSQSRAELATQSSWKLLSVGIDGNKDGTPETDATSLVQSCQLDNVYTFKMGGTGTADEGATKCNSTDAQTTSFYWTLKNNDNVIGGNFGIFNGDANISLLNSTQFVLWKDTTYMSQSMRMYMTLVH
ncbi:MAG: hypothetical protein JST39_14235 [Bacteroidetes bacterium]|nr:hypothetical protein [Bacteroidota bacterium]